MPLVPRRLALAGLLALAAGACTQSPIPSEPDHAPAAARLTALPPAEQQIIGASNTFSFSLWNRINATQRGTNVFISPLSASFSLGMTLNGAAGQTADEMRAALGFGTLSQTEINAGYQSLIALLSSLDPAVQTQIANAIWSRNGFPFRQTFLDAGRSYFNAEVQGLDFANKIAALGMINGWVNDKTNGKIPSILDDIHADDVMFLINAIYFNGSWRTKFDAAQTSDATFHAFDGTTPSMRLMTREGSIAYAETPTYQAVDLPYGNAAFTMTVVLPKSTTDVETVAASLTPASWQTLTGTFADQAVTLSLPKLQLAYERGLIDDLKALGMQRAFLAGGADFTAMSPLGDQLYISLVKQKTFVDIHEEGTEAAAATVTGIALTSTAVPRVMRVDRPYIFAIRERLTGTVLFMGKVVRMP